MIYSMNMARLFFTNGFVNHEPGETLLDAGHVEPEYEELIEKYSERDFPENDKENDYTILVKKQDANKFRSKSPVAIVMRKEVLSPFGFVDDYYYYIIQRKKFSKYWNRDLGLVKFEERRSEKTGIQIPFTILKHIDRNNAEKVSEIVVVLEDGSIYYAPSRTLFNFFREQNMPLFVNSYATMLTGFPKELFSEKWK